MFELDRQSFLLLTKRITLAVAKEVLEKAKHNIKFKDYIMQSTKSVYHTKIYFEGELSGSGFILRNEAGHGFRVVFGAQHAVAVEYGLPPGTWQSIDKIKTWLFKKLNLKLDEKQLSHVALAVANKIHNEGYDARPFLRNAIAVTAKTFSPRSVQILES